MFNRLMPFQADNSYQGRKFALWIFALILLVLAAISIGSIFNGHNAAKDADGIPLDTFTPAGTQAVVTMYALWGVTQIIIVILGLIVLIWYRTLVPLMFTVLLVEQLLLRLVHYFLPIARSEGDSVSWFIILFVVLMALGLFLSLWQRRIET